MGEKFQRKKFQMGWEIWEYTLDEKSQEMGEGEVILRQKNIHLVRIPKKYIKGLHCRNTERTNT